jgi:hypothetical protein
MWTKRAVDMNDELYVEMNLEGSDCMYCIWQEGQKKTRKPCQLNRPPN